MARDLFVLVIPAFVTIKIVLKKSEPFLFSRQSGLYSDCLL
jgi:hypothetical protein